MAMACQPPQYRMGCFQPSMDARKILQACFGLWRTWGTPQVEFEVEDLAYVHPWLNQAALSTLEIMQVKSEENPSDPLTRRRPLCAQRNTNFVRLLQLFRTGLHMQTAPYRRASGPGLHHRELENDADSSDDEANKEDPEVGFLENATAAHVLSSNLRSRENA